MAAACRNLLIPVEPGGFEQLQNHLQWPSAVWCPFCRPQRTPPRGIPVRVVLGLAFQFVVLRPDNLLAGNLNRPWSDHFARMLSGAALWKTLRASRTSFRGCRKGVRLPSGMAFTFRPERFGPESRSASSRNAVRLGRNPHTSRPISKLLCGQGG